MLGPLVSHPRGGHGAPHHPLQLLRPPLHTGKDHPAPGLLGIQRVGGAGDDEGLPEQEQEGGVQLAGPGPGQASRGGGQQNGSQQRIKYPLIANSQILHFDILQTKYILPGFIDRADRITVSKSYLVIILLWY